MFEEFARRNYPYVVINGEPAAPGEPVIPSIGVDNESGMRQIAELIRRKGYESVGFAGELTPNPQSHHLERVRALERFLAGSGCRFSPELVLNGSGSGIPEVPRVGRYSHEDGRVILQYLHERKQIPRCMVCGDDDIAMGLLKAAREYGIRIPEELAVIGFDDDVNADYLVRAADFRAPAA